MLILFHCTRGQGRGRAAAKARQQRFSRYVAQTDEAPPAALAAKKEEISSDGLAKQLEETRVLDEDFKEEKFNYDIARLKRTHLQNVLIF